MVLATSVTAEIFSNIIAIASRIGPASPTLKNDRSVSHLFKEEYIKEEELALRVVVIYLFC